MDKIVDFFRVSQNDGGLNIIGTLIVVQAVLTQTLEWIGKILAIFGAGS